MLKEQQKIYLPFQLFLDLISIVLAYAVSSGLFCFVEAAANGAGPAAPASFFSGEGILVACGRHLYISPFLFVLIAVCLYLCENYHFIGISKPAAIIKRVTAAGLLSLVIFCFQRKISGKSFLV